MITLKAARVNAGLTQEQAAKHLGISEQTLLNYEKARSFPDVRILRKIEDLYGVSYRQIIFDPTIPV